MSLSQPVTLKNKSPPRKVRDLRGGGIEEGTGWGVGWPGWGQDNAVEYGTKDSWIKLTYTYFLTDNDLKAQSINTIFYVNPFYRNSVYTLYMLLFLVCVMSCDNKGKTVVFATVLSIFYNVAFNTSTCMKEVWLRQHSAALLKSCLTDGHLFYMTPYLITPFCHCFIHLENLGYRFDIFWGLTIGWIVWDGRSNHCTFTASILSLHPALTRHSHVRRHSR